MQVNKNVIVFKFYINILYLGNCITNTNVFGSTKYISFLLLLFYDDL